MKVDFERSGGFAGLRVTVTVDTEALSPEEARQLEENLAAASFFDLPEKILSPQEGMDRFYYRITVEEPERKHTVEFGEAAAPESLQPLVRQLVLLGRSFRQS